MRNKLSCGAALIAAGAILSGCQTGMPQAENFPNQKQLVLNSAGQWQVLAAWTVDQLSHSLPSGKTINVQAPGDSPFANSFAEFLATDLVGKGYIVGHDNSGPTIHFDVEVIEHGHIPPPQPLAFTFLGTMGGLATWVLDTQSIQSDAGSAFGLAAGPAIDIKRGYFPAPTDTEVAVTTSISQYTQRYAGRSDVFYISRADKEQYDTPGESEVNLVSDDKNM